MTPCRYGNNRPVCIPCSLLKLRHPHVPFASNLSRLLIAPSVYRWSLLARGCYFLPSSNINSVSEHTCTLPHAIFPEHSSVARTNLLLILLTSIEQKHFKIPFIAPQKLLHQEDLYKPPTLSHPVSLPVHSHMF